MKFKGSKSSIHLVARGLLLHGNNIILCRTKGADWFFLPGGHIENGESAKGALMRELREEMGDGDYNIDSFIGVCENVFPLDEKFFQHELNIVFAVNVPNDIQLETKEDHIEFISVAKDDLKNYKILPATLKNGIIEWLGGNKTLFKEL